MYKYFLPLLLALLSTVGGICQPGWANNFIIMEGDILATLKTSLQSRIDKGNIPEINHLVKQADQKLEVGPFSVVHKKQVPPSGDKHDYISMGPYWWPDPEKEDGLPYIRRDGEVNPEYYEYTDTEELERFMEAMKILSEAYFFTDREEYAAHAIKLFHTWFLDPDTKMNPNLNFGQRIPGITEGRRSGIIDTRNFVLLPDLITLLSGSEHWKEAYEKEIKDWLGAYVDWLINSQHGKEEAVHGNNHSTWYFTQIIPLTLYLGQKNRADSLAQGGFPIIMEQMIAEDGSQPKELNRTRTWDYSTMNLLAMFYYAKVCEHLGLNLWNYTNEMGGSLKKALNFLALYGKGDKKWDFKQITPFEYDIMKKCLHIGAVKFNNENYLILAKDLYSSNGEFHYLDLLYYIE